MSHWVKEIFIFHQYISALIPRLQVNLMGMCTHHLVTSLRTVQQLNCTAPLPSEPLYWVLFSLFVHSPVRSINTSFKQIILHVYSSDII